MTLGDDVGVAVTVTHANTGIQCLCPCVDLPFDDPVEAVERTFEATEMQFVVRARRQAALDALAARCIDQPGAAMEPTEIRPLHRETEPAPGELELGDPARPQLRPVSA